MLPSNLLITRRYRDKIYPVYARLSDENLNISKLVIQIYKDHIGKTKGELKETIKEIENLGYDYRYVRGLSVLLDRRCRLESKASIDPVEARREVFRIAHRGELPTTGDARNSVLRQVASKFGIETGELEESLYADMEDNLLLFEFTPLDPETLIKMFNISLTQTLLFYSTEIIFTTKGSWQEIFRQIKWLGLIYTIRKVEGVFQVKVDGPLSLFRLSRRYGTRLAKLLPIIIEGNEWEVKAKILRYRAERRLLNLELSNKKHGEFVGSSELLRERESYDSRVEEDFANRFRALDTGWKLEREPDPIPVNNHVMIPDFSLHKAGMKIYLEIMGFWTPQYLRQKIKKLERVENMDMIVAVDKNLACQKLEEVGKKMNLIYYKSKVPLKPIVAYLKSKEDYLASKQAEELLSRGIQIQAPVMDVEELARKLKVLEVAVRRTLRRRKMQGYRQLGDMLIKESKLKEIQRRIEKQLDKGELGLEEASRIIQEAGGRRSASILNALGYEVNWQGIDPRSAKVRKRQN